MSQTAPGRSALPRVGLALASIVVLLSSLTAQENLLVAIGDEWLYTRGDIAPPADWFDPDFDDSTWIPGPTGIGYGDGDDATVLADMQNVYVSVFTRRRFPVAAPGSVSSMVLRIAYDDGFVAYLNGAEVARSANMVAAGTPVDFAAFASPDHEALAVESFSIDPSLLTGGENVLAIQVHNASLASSDLSLLPELVANASICVQLPACTFQVGTGVVLNWTNTATYTALKIERDGVEIADIDPLSTTYLDFAPPPGDVNYTVVSFSEEERCESAPCSVRVFAGEDVLIGPSDEWRFYRGSTSPPFDWREVAFDDSEWEAGPTGIGYGDGDDLTEVLDMMPVADDPLTPEDETWPGYLAVFLRKDLDLPVLAGLESLVLSVVHDDGFVVYVNGQEVGRINVLDGVADEFTPAAAAIEPGAPATLEIPVSRLRAGRNVLAVSLHNADVTSSDLSFIPVVAKVGSLPAAPRFLRGNVDALGGVNITDAVFLLRSLFQGGATPTCLDAADADDSGGVNITDAVVILRSLFQGGGDLPAPFPACGVDGTPGDPLAACTGSGC